MVPFQNTALTSASAGYGRALSMVTVMAALRCIGMRDRSGCGLIGWHGNLRMVQWRMIWCQIIFVESLGVYDRLILSR